MVSQSAIDLDFPLKIAHLVPLGNPHSACEEQGERDKAAAVFKLAGLLEMLGASLAFVLIWLLAPWGARFFGRDEASASLWILYGVVVLVNMLYESSTGLLQVFDRFRPMAETTLGRIG